MIEANRFRNFRSFVKLQYTVITHISVMQNSLLFHHT